MHGSLLYRKTLKENFQRFLGHPEEQDLLQILWYFSHTCAAELFHLFSFLRSWVNLLQVGSLEDVLKKMEVRRYYQVNTILMSDLPSKI